MKRILKTTLIGTALALALSSPLMAMEVKSVSEAREHVARNVASLLNDPAFDSAVRMRLSKNKAMLSDVMLSYAGSDSAKATGDVTADMHDLERQAIRMRGLDGALDAMFDLRVYGVAEDKPLTSVRDFWTATVSTDATTGQKQVVAYDSSGAEHRFPLDAAPDVPMLIVESEGGRALQAGMQIVNEALRGAGMQSTVNRGLKRGSATEELTIVTDMYLAVDEEPNIQGDAEIFAVVSGLDPEGKPKVSVKEMDWLDRDKTWYRYPPGRDLISWAGFGSGYVTVQLFEDDGDTDFTGLAAAIVAGLGGVGAAVVAPGVGAAIVPVLQAMAEKILASMKGSFFQNSKDYVDTFYLIERGKSYGTKEEPLLGMRGNAQMILAPKTVSSFVPAK